MSQRIGFLRQGIREDNHCPTEYFFPLDDGVNVIEGILTSQDNFRAGRFNFLTSLPCLLPSFLFLSQHLFFMPIPGGPQWFAFALDLPSSFLW